MQDLIELHVHLAKEVLFWSTNLSTISEMQISGGAGEEPNGKQALTKFQRICTDGAHSIVLCKPVTGRTHQVFFWVVFIAMHLCILVVRCILQSNNKQHDNLPLSLDLRN
jgi:hypothetical protein